MFDVVHFYLFENNHAFAVRGYQFLQDLLLSRYGWNYMERWKVNTWKVNTIA